MLQVELVGGDWSVKMDFPLGAVLLIVSSHEIWSFQSLWHPPHALKMETGACNPSSWAM